MTSIYRKLTEAGVDKKDIEILDVLASEKKFTEKDYQEIGKKVGVRSAEAKKRINALREKKILLKDNVSILDQVRIWDGYYIVQIKAAIQPPVIGMATKFPTGWVINDYLEGLRQVEKDMGVNMIRHAYSTQGTEWDLLLIVSAKSQKEYVEYFSRVAKQGWMSKGWSIIPVELGNRWVFDPVSSPDPKIVIESTEKVLKDAHE